MDRQGIPPSPPTKKDEDEGCQDIRKFMVKRTAEELLQSTKSLKQPPEPPYVYIRVARIDGSVVWKKSYANIYQ